MQFINPQDSLIDPKHITKQPTVKSEISNEYEEFRHNNGTIKFFAGAKVRRSLADIEEQKMFFR